jgi:hypothetical protein
MPTDPFTLESTPDFAIKKFNEITDGFIAWITDGVIDPRKGE